MSLRYQEGIEKINTAEMKRQRIEDITSSLKSLYPKNISKILALSSALFIASPNSTHGEPQCKLGQQSLAPHSVLDGNGDATDTEYAFLRCLPYMKIQIYLPDEYEMQEYGYSREDFQTYMKVIEDVGFQNFVFPLFQDVFEETAINLGGIDFIPFIDLYLAGKNKDQKEYSIQINRIITGYSALPFEKIFIQRGVKSI